MPFGSFHHFVSLPSLQLTSNTLKPFDSAFSSRSADPTVTLFATVKVRNLADNTDEKQGLESGPRSCRGNGEGVFPPPAPPQGLAASLPFTVGF